MEQDIFQANYCAERLKALGDPLRLRIVDALRGGELSVSSLAEALDTGIVTVSHHLQILKHANLVETRRDGRFIYYRLHDDVVAGANSEAPTTLDLGCCRIDVARD